MGSTHGSHKNVDKSGLTVYKQIIKWQPNMGLDCCSLFGRRAEIRFMDYKIILSACTQSNALLGKPAFCICLFNVGVGVVPNSLISKRTVIEPKTNGFLMLESLDRTKWFRFGLVGFISKTEISKLLKQIPLRSSIVKS